MPAGQGSYLGARPATTLPFMRFEQVEAGPVTYPVLVCETCGEHITKDRPGLIAFGTDENDRRTSTDVVVHKGACDHSGTDGLPWEELHRFFYQLVFNSTGIDLTKVDPEMMHD